MLQLCLISWGQFNKFKYQAAPPECRISLQLTPNVIFDSERLKKLPYYLSIFSTYIK